MNICKINTFKRFFCVVQQSNIFCSLSFDCASLFLTFSSSITKNFIAVFLSILLSAIFRVGGFKGKSSLEDFLWKRAYLVFSLFRDNLFALNKTPFSQFFIKYFKKCKYWVMEQPRTENKKFSKEIFYIKQCFYTHKIFSYFGIFYISRTS